MIGKMIRVTGLLAIVGFASCTDTSTRRDVGVVDDYSQYESNEYDALSSYDFDMALEQSIGVICEELYAYGVYSWAEFVNVEWSYWPTFQTAFEASSGGVTFTPLMEVQTRAMIRERCF